MTAEAERTVRLAAPTGVGAVVRLLSGRLVALPPDRTIEVAEGDARPLIACGWRPADGETLGEADACVRRSVAELAAEAGGIVSSISHV